MITYKDFTAKPAEPESKGLSIFYGTIWVAYAANPAIAGQLIASFADMYNRGARDAKLAVQRAIGL